MADPNVVAGSFGGGSGAGRSTPPDFYSTLAARRQSAPTPQPKQETQQDEAIKALQAVFEVFKKLQTMLGGKDSPNLDAAKESLKKFVAMDLKKDPAALDGGAKPPAEPPAQTPPPDQVPAAS